MIKAAIFDLDGTLADTVESIAFCANESLKQLGLKTHPVEAYKTFAGDGAKKLLERCLVASGDLKLTKWNEIWDIYGTLFEKYCTRGVTPFPGIMEMLETLKEEGIKLAVLSNKEHLQTVKVVKTVFPPDTFELIQGRIEGLPRKPDPTPALYVANQIGVEPQECIYIGDTDTDMKTGKSAGMFSVGVLWGFRKEEELRKNGADFIAKNPIDIINLISNKMQQED